MQFHKSKLDFILYIILQAQTDTKPNERSIRCIPHSQQNYAAVLRTHRTTANSQLVPLTYAE